MFLPLDIAAFIVGAGVYAWRSPAGHAFDALLAGLIVAVLVNTLARATG